MSGFLLRRCIALAVVGLWLTPGAGALALGLHVALDHHGDDSGHEPPQLMELLLAAVHGHHHHAAAPPHEHAAHLDAAPGLSPSQGPCATVAEAPRLATDDDHGEVAASCRRRAPPVPLFNVNCSLLL